MESLDPDNCWKLPLLSTHANRRRPRHQKFAALIRRVLSIAPMPALCRRWLTAADCLTNPGLDSNRHTSDGAISVVVHWRVPLSRTAFRWPAKKGQLDRLVHARRLTLNGESMRKTVPSLPNSASGRAHEPHEAVDGSRCPP